MSWLWRSHPHRLSKSQSPITVLLRTTVTQMIMLNQGTSFFCLQISVLPCFRYFSVNVFRLGSLNKLSSLFPLRFCRRFYLLLRFKNSIEVVYPTGHFKNIIPKKAKLLFARKIKRLRHCHVLALFFFLRVSIVSLQPSSPKMLYARACVKFNKHGPHKTTLFLNTKLRTTSKWTKNIKTSIYNFFLWVLYNVRMYCWDFKLPVRTDLIKCYTANVCKNGTLPRTSYSSYYWELFKTCEPR